ncbi:MAG: hypothetical protein SynsKO_04370 [Synoicihabitans sp.]
MFAPQVASAAFTVEGREIHLDGSPFQVRGVCYQPAPIGDNPSAAAPYGDYFTANYSALTDRDLPLMRELGANVVRIYGWNETADHAAFLDACYNGGVDPIYVLINRWIDPNTNWNDASAVSAIQQTFVQIDQNLGSHPAVMGIILGNEANIYNGNGDNAAFWGAMNQVAQAIKAQTPTRLLSVAITDSIPQVAAHDSSVPGLDFWSVQTYRGSTLGTFFTEYADASTKPLVITEFGADAFDHQAQAEYPNNAEFVGQTVAGLWREVAANSDIAAGACVFEFGDEWWKSQGGSPSVQDAGGFPISLPDGFANEEWWGLYRVIDNGSDLDILEPRATVAALKEAWAVNDEPEPSGDLSIVVPPVSQTIVPGGTATFSPTIGGAPEGSTVTYQWFKDGVAIPGETASTLVLANLSPTQNGLYAVRVADGTSTVTSPPATLLVATPAPGRLKNLSVRSRSGSGASALVAGFVVSGGPAQLLVRGVGPELATYGVSGVSPDPQLQLYTGQTAGLFNEDWGSNANAIRTAAAAVGAFALTAGSKDAAILVDVDGPRSVHLRDETAGVALAEVYEVGTNTGRLVNVSARTLAGTGDNVLVVGFVVDGNVPKQLLLRGVGPTLSTYGVSGALENPVLTLFDSSQEIVAENDDWNADLVSSVASAVGAFALDADSADAALVYTVVPGAYTAQVSGAGGASGTALVEVYEVPEV